MLAADRIDSFSPVSGARRMGATLLMALFGTMTACLELRPPAACSVSVAPASLTLPVNGAATIVGTAFNCDGNSIRNKRVNFSSSNSAVVTVTTEGGVIAVGVGNATVSATADGKSASVPVTVTPEQAATVTVTPNTLTLRRTNTRQLAAVARNNQNVIITGRTFRWSSSNSSVVSVDQTGSLTAIAAGGPVVITAESDQTVGSASILVTEIPIGACTLTPLNSKVTVGQSAQPVLALRDTANNPLPTLGRAISWASDNETVATVSTTGFVTTRRAGRATITASPIENPQIRCTSTVEAVEPRIDKVIISPRVGSLRLGIPRTFGVLLLDSANVQIPTGRIVTWTTNTPTVAQVSQVGIVTGVSLGTARIIASAEGVSDTVSLAVTRVPVATVSVTPLQATVTEGQTVQLRATVTDSAGVDVTDRPLEWITSDPSRATVNANGLVSTISAGTVVITATSENRVSQASIIIQQIPVDSIIVPATFAITRGVTLPFAIELRDAVGNILRNRVVDVRSSRPDVANVPSTTSTAQVAVTGLQVGTAVITLQALNTVTGQAQGKVSQITVTVTAPGPAAPPPAALKR
jgi:uncharacterized protein YjdB